MSFGTPGRRVAIITGVRTPFAKAGTVLKDLSAIDLGKRCVAELIQRGRPIARPVVAPQHSPQVVHLKRTG